MVSPVTGNPFAGLMQGAQAAQGLMGAFRAPQLHQLQLLQEQARLQQMQGLDPVSQSQIAAREAQTGLAQRKEDRLRQEQETESLSAIAYAANQLDDEDRQRFVNAVAPRFGIDPAEVTPEDITQFANMYESQFKKGGVTRGESAQFKDSSGNTYAVSTVMDKAGNTRQVVTPLTPGAPQSPTGPLEQVSKATGMTSTERVKLATEEALTTAEARELGKRRDEIKANYTSSRNKAISSKRSISDLTSIVKGFGEGGLSRTGRTLAAKFPLLRDASEEEFLSLANQVILSRKDELLGGGILSDADILLLQSVGPQLGSTKEGNLRILENMRLANEASVANAKAFDEHIKAGGNPEDFVIPDRLDPSAFAEAPQQTKFIPGRIYKDGSGGRARYNPDGTWTEIK